jgi:guanosine-3',5'-bis(diphosphate) 3'-pyrophosphohydrolase
MSIEHGTSGQDLSIAHKNETPEIIIRALKVATIAHKDQYRKSGEPYITHPIAVEKILSEEWGIKNEEMRAAALLHDAIEDSNLKVGEITNTFGQKIAYLVSSQTNLDASTAGASSEEWKKIKDRENQRKILARSFLDPKVGVGKLADRLHNMRTLDPMPPEKQQYTSDETRRVYAPLAEALGMWLVKNELEDLSFYYLDPEFYLKIKCEIDSDQRLSEESIGFWKSRLKLLLDENSIDGEVQAKKNGYWSIVNKRRRQSVFKESSFSGFSDINDVVSYRLILEKEEDCYQVLGLIHKEFGDQIDFERDDVFMHANKRDNGYQALQTTLSTDYGDIEIAMMTREMEEFNNWGVVSLIRRGEENLNDYRLKLVFTPSEDVKFLKPQATGIDFAYQISESLGADAEEVLIDGERHSIATVIPNATVVEVIPTKDTRLAPPRDFLKYCLPETQRMIDKQLIISENQKTISDTKIYLNNILLRKRGLLEFEDLDKGIKRQILNRFGVTDFDSLFLKYAENQSIDRLASKVDEMLCKLGLDKEQSGLSTILIEGIDTPGVIAEVSSWIMERQGNIKRISHESDGQRYEVRLVVEGIGLSGEEYMAERLKNDKRFDKWIVV